MEKNKNNLVIYQKYMELIEYTNNILRKYVLRYMFSKTFALVKECKSTLYTGLRLLIYAIKAFHKQDKLKYLNELDTNLHIMKVHIRLSYKYKYISMQNYQTWSNLITNICNMLGGWINSCQKR